MTHLPEELTQRLGPGTIVAASVNGETGLWVGFTINGDPNWMLMDRSRLSAAGGKVHREAKKFIADYAYLLIDCPPAIDSPVPQSALLISDLALVPIIPSPADLWAATGIQKLIDLVMPVNEELQTRLVANMVQATSLSRDALEAMERFGISQLRASLGLRTAYRQSAVWGGVVQDQPKEAKVAIKEVDALLDEVLAVLHG